MACTSCGRASRAFSCSKFILEFSAYFPMVAEGIDHAADAPAVFFGYRIDFLCARFDRAGEDGVRIVDRQNDAYRDATERFRAEVVMFRRFIAEPELGSVDGESGNHTLGISHAKDLYGTEGSLVEVDGTRATANAEPGSNRGRDSSC